ncbi:antitoxin Xre/MbcA/ParS toxin-binding domain-containing protein [Limimaricola pyoseonensis]|uniref:Uncharacterized protein n=1 Tax=Limimaricola pyoseonensis TaxID=521013 RepID=A0A1G7FXB7_9RHOB|nr:antitoxin Xre/MbcA/ParS toxin-binding domain-containing protein [Limimaricola pyoseonensis]SDE80520.1 Protein of unknown function [Limimaricola pyoseonensis]
MHERNLGASGAARLLDADEVARGLRRWVPLGASLAENWAREGRVIGVTRAGRTLYPACQFDRAGLPIAAMQEVIRALRPQRGAEGVLDWLHAPCPALGGRAPAERLPETPAAVAAAAAAAARRHAA